jgi:tetratricopeptide (TPR) repeat protein
MNRILARIAHGQYAQGLAVYEGLRAATPNEERLAGICLFNLQELHGAKNILLNARARGCHAAGIELASVYRHLGLLDLSRAAFDGVDLERLSVLDRALALREKGAQLHTAGDASGAIAVLEQAWAVAHEAPLGRLALTAIGHALGVSYADRGLDRRAAVYLTDALARAHPARSVQLRAARALCLAYLGELEPAEQDLRAAMDDQDLVPVAAPYLEYVSGVFEVVRGHIDSADAHFAQSAALARSGQEPETEAYALLGRCAIATSGGREDHAYGYLCRARSLSMSEKVDALVQLREGAILARRGDGAAIAVLEAAAAIFARLGLLREEAWAWLQAAAAHLASANRDGALTALSRATHLRWTLASAGPLVFELRMVPAVSEWIATLGDDDYAKGLRHDLITVSATPESSLELRTLGANELLLDGRCVRLDLRRSLEVLTYLLDHPNVPLEQVLLDLFPDSDGAHGRNYFHQVRYALARAVPGLQVPYDRDTRTYRVSLDGLAVHSDVDRLRRAVDHGGERGLDDALTLHRGPFLPHAESEWAEVEREDVASSIVRLGLEVMQVWASRGRQDRCLDLVDRLLEIDPFNEALSEYLVGAARAVQGEAAALHAVHRLGRRFERELGSLPPRLERLRHP